MRKYHRYVDVATQHRVYAALRVFLNYELKRVHAIPFNPIFAVELEPETRGTSLVWTPDQVAHFLEFTAMTGSISCGA